jgi:hypothetical protein
VSTTLAQVIEIRAHAPRIELPDGGSAALVDGALEVRDPAGVLRIRYDGEVAEVAAPRDLKLTAPRGQVRIEAATDVVVTAGRDVTHAASRSLELSAALAQKVVLDPQRTRVTAGRLEVCAQHSHLATGAATVVARKLHTVADELVQKADRYEVVATQVVEKARSVLREVSGLYESRLGRVRSLVQGAFSLRSQRTVMVSKQDTTIDGERVLLG